MAADGLHRVWASPTRIDELRGLSDAALLTLVRRGDVDALEVVYDRHIDAVWRVALAFAPSPKDAERAVFAAFTTLWLEPEPSGSASLAAGLLSSVWREAVRDPAASISPALTGD